MLSDWEKKFTRRVFSTIPINPGGWSLENPKLRNKDHPNANGVIARTLDKTYSMALETR